MIGPLRLFAMVEGKMRRVGVKIKGFHKWCQCLFLIYKKRAKLPNSLLPFVPHINFNVSYFSPSAIRSTMACDLGHQAW